MVSPDVMQDIDKLIDAAEKVEANLDMSTKQAKGQNQEQPQSERPRGSGCAQANYVDRNRGDNRHRSAPYPTHGRGRGAAVNAVQALPPQEVQFNAAQAFDEHHPANNWTPHDVCNNCGQAGHRWRECPCLPRQYMPAPQAGGGAGRGRGRGRGMAGLSIYSSVFGQEKTDPKVKFLVKWAGYEDEHNTWEPYKNLKNAPAALNEYWDTVAVRAAAKSKKRGPDGYMAPVSKKLKGK
ncbi:TPA: hypothetical protein ACH3X1_016223 [Trebouxia sp. C0004]